MVTFPREIPEAWSKVHTLAHRTVSTCHLNISQAALAFASGRTRADISDMADCEVGCSKTDEARVPIPVDVPS